jgi:hypothetical protein
MDIIRNNDGTLPAYGWPGGYPIFYVTADGGVLCPECGNGRNGSEASENTDDAQWRLVGGDVHWEGEPLQCEHCNASIESAYGEN